MKLTDLASTEKWAELEKSIHEQTGLNAAVFDPDGVRVTSYVKWANALCPAIKSDPKGQTYICSVAHQNIAARAIKSEEAVVDACDAGLIKIVAPIMVNNRCIGVAGGCGLLPEGGEVESFHINSVMDIAMERVEALARGMAVLSPELAQSASELIQRKIKDLVTGFHRERDESFTD